MSHIYIFTGKGGVGKSCVSSAHAYLSAEQGVKTLLVSTDMAHNLGDIFEIKMGNEPVSLSENLDLYEIDPNTVMENDFKEMTNAIKNMLPGMDADNLENFGMIPGMEELFALLKIARIYKAGTYERIIVDCAPTGETLSLLKFPELLSWYMEKLFPIGKVAVRALSPISRKMFQVTMPDKAAMNDMEKVYYEMFRLQEMLKDRTVTSIRLVTVPEKMVVEETKRNYMYLNLYNFNVDGIYINRILPEDIHNTFFTQWLEIQETYLKEIEQSFAALPMYRIPWYGEEIRGSSAVARICSDVLEKRDVFKQIAISDRETYETNELGYLLKVHLPFVDKKEIDFFQTNTDAVLKIGNFKRNIPLPNLLRTYTITSARYEQDDLNIQFEKEAGADE